MCNCGQKNTDKVTSDNIIYSGSFLPTLNIMPNDNLTDILGTIDTYLSTFIGGDYIIKGGINTQTADGLTLVFNIPHTLGQVPTTYSVEPTNQQTANNFSITTTLTNLVITYPVAPSQGTNLSWAWQVIKT